MTTAIMKKKKVENKFYKDSNIVGTEDQDKENKLSALKARLFWGSLALESGDPLCHVHIFLNIAYPIGW